MVGILGFADKNQPSLPTPFYSALGIYFCLHSPFNCISFLKFSFSPDVILSGWLGSKHQVTNLWEHRCELVLSKCTILLGSFSAPYTNLDLSVHLTELYLIVSHQLIYHRTHWTVLPFTDQEKTTFTSASMLAICQEHSHFSETRDFLSFLFCFWTMSHFLIILTLRGKDSKELCLVT